MNTEECEIYRREKTFYSKLTDKQCNMHQELYNMICPPLSSYPYPSLKDYPESLKDFFKKMQNGGYSTEWMIAEWLIQGNDYETKEIEEAERQKMIRILETMMDSSCRL